MQEVRHDGIRVSTVMPGSVRTGILGRRRRPGTDWKLAPEDVAQVVVDLLHHPRTQPAEPRRASSVASPAKVTAVIDPQPSGFPDSMPNAIGPYQVLERLGAGGLGEVFRARDTIHGRTVVIKRVPSAIAPDSERGSVAPRACAVAE